MNEKSLQLAIQEFPQRGFILEKINTVTELFLVTIGPIGGGIGLQQ